MKVMRDDSGAVTLIEIMVTAALGSILLSVVGMVALFTEKSANTAGSEFGAARRAGTVLTSAISSLGSALPAHGCALFADGKAGQRSRSICRLSVGL